MRARPVLVAVTAIAVSMAGLAGCQTLSGLSELEKDEAFDPDADAGFDVSFPDPDAPVADAPAADTGAADTAPAETTPSDGDAASCEGKVLDGHCYFLLPTDQTWTAARDACAAAGAHLVTFDSAAEYAVLADVGTGDRWIGLSRPDTVDDAGRFSKDSFQWITGDPVTLDNWHVPPPDAGLPEPDGSGACVRARGDGKWADRDCASPLKGVCERE